mmetsp:Transcript_10504/g.26441  ORF Transcript_10504/g.26441 Transcript_10504/m.26441 type:complete len:203 (+) Transcript_10504:1816-2424(+)
MQRLEAHVRAKRAHDAVGELAVEHRAHALSVRHSDARDKRVEFGRLARGAVLQHEEAAEGGEGVPLEHHIHDREPHLARAQRKHVAVLAAVDHRLHRHVHEHERGPPRDRGAPDRLADRRARRVVDVALDEQPEERVDARAQQRVGRAGRAALGHVGRVAHGRGDVLVAVELAHGLGRLVVDRRDGRLRDGHGAEPMHAQQR